MPAQLFNTNPHLQRLGTRATPRRGKGSHVEPSRSLRGPNGRPLCRLCWEEIPKGRQTFCGQACVDRWLLTSDPGEARRQVFKRDHGTCALCAKQGVRGGWEMDHTIPLVEGGLNKMTNLRTLCILCHKAETAKLRKRLALHRKQARYVEPWPSRAEETE